MWNYQEIDRYITIDHLLLIVNWYTQNGYGQKEGYPDIMISSIIRNKNEYIIHETTAYNGCSRKFKIENNEAVHLGVDDTWMS